MANMWTPALATGVSSVDAQHRELFRQFGLLTEAMSKGKGRDEITKTLNFLGDYVVRHFAEEERIMDQCRCPAAAANKQAHAQLLSKFKAMRERLEKEGVGPTLVLEMQKALSDWLVHHIEQIDTQLRDCAEDAGRKTVGAAS